MNTKYRISEDDYVNAAKLFSKLTAQQIIIYFLVALLLLALAIFGPIIIKAGAIGGLIGGLTVGLTIRYIVTPTLSRRHYRKYKAIHDEFEIELFEDGVHMASPSGSGKVIWSNIFKWRQNERYILIYPMPRLYYIVPKSLESNGFNISLLTKQLTQNVGNSA